MTIDYTTSQNVFDYGKVTSPSVTEQAVMAALVTATSRKIDDYCNMYFSSTAWTARVFPARVDVEGVLTAWLPSPTVTALTAADWRLGAQSTWTSIDSTLFDTETDIEPGLDGCVLRVLDQSYRVYRGRRLQMRVTYTGGWASLSDIPSSFEWAVRRACWWEYKKRDAPMEKTAMPQLGVVVVPQSWPPDLKEAFKPYVHWQA